MMIKPNQRVTTPIGPGVIECAWQLRQRDRVLVRVRITDENREHLRDLNCLTPTNQIFGSWIYDAAEIDQCLMPRSPAVSISA